MTNARLEQAVERVFYVGVAILCGVSIGVCNDQRAQRVRAQEDFAGLVADVEKNCTIARDGSGVCKPGTFSTVEIATRGRVR